ncbi:AraC family transcriptional regulator [Psychromicrobium sp. YIM B11713]|uniref:AraC family transcriptional regulator n=1 Tax=Psychromicrobium sp. YIM B11713 TaxID=3145233 RepID=UPI00374EBF15
MGKHPLSQHLVAQTTDPQSASTTMKSHFGVKSLFFNPTVETVDFTLSQIELGTIQISYFKYGEEVVVQPDTSRERVFVGIPIRGSARVRVQSEHFISGPEWGTVISPGMDTTISRSKSMDGLLLSIPCHSLEPFLSCLPPDEKIKDLHFSPALNMLDPAVQSWLRMLRTLLIDLNNAVPLFRSPILSVNAEQMIIVGLVHAHPNRHASLPRSTHKCAQRALGQVLQVMQEMPEHPWRVAELAALAGVSVRTLQTHFRKEFGVGPVTKLQQIRLRNIRRALTLASPDEISITEMALKWGFGNPGRFAAIYYRTFQEYPSDTLHR